MIMRLRNNVSRPRHIFVGGLVERWVLPMTRLWEHHLIMNSKRLGLCYVEPITMLCKLRVEVQRDS